VQDGRRTRVRIVVRGAVQGVGFRPFVYRAATRLGLRGWVRNTGAGVLIEAEGEEEVLRRFLASLEAERPPLAVIQGLEHTWLDPAGRTGFAIDESEPAGAPTALVLPDIATCPDCLREVLDPSDRRYLYPFANCTNCGPRYTIIEGLPYDRPATAMARFRMCRDCEREYEDPTDRRFHAQPIACPVCGPRLELRSATGGPLAAGHEALLDASAALRRGEIVAVKGIGGFHLMADARNVGAVGALRTRKKREEKPFALMFPSVDRVREVCRVSPAEERLLCAPEAPIVILDRIRGVEGGTERAVADEVAPRNPSLGVMLPSTPLHHLLMRELGFPVVATSGNLSDEPICTDEDEAQVRLKGIADLFLVHDRPIVRHVDDSIVRVMAGRELVIRRARGFAPLPVPLPLEVEGGPMLGVGAHLKNSVALSAGGGIIASQHIGDLETHEAHAAFRSVIADLTRLYAAAPLLVVHDLHPDYPSTRYALERGGETLGMQHHFAHVAACMAENALEGPVLGVAWDGTGYGPDGTVWGGEFLVAETHRFERFAALRTFMLPGGEAAVKQPRRSALGVLFELFGGEVFERDGLPLVASFTPEERRVLRGMLAGGLNAPRTSSAGRLFDAVAALLNIRREIRFEGQAAMELEFALAGVDSDSAYPVEVAGSPQGHRSVDWGPMIREILAGVARGEPEGLISARFHNTLVEAIVAVAEQAGLERVVLTGGCFQNRYLTERSIRRLHEAGFRPYWHQRIPPNDGGIAVGQIAVAAAMRRRAAADVSGGEA